MGNRTGDSGSNLVTRTVEATVPAILDGDTADVVIAGDLAWATGAGKPPKIVDAKFIGPASEAGLGIVGAWVSNVATGAVTVRFCAVGAAVTGGAQDVLLVEPCLA